MPPAEIVNRVPADEIVPSQISADIVQVDDVVPNDAVRSELSENKIARSKVRAEDRHLAVRDSLFPLDLTDGLERSRDFVRRLRHPTIRTLRGTEGHADLGRLPGDLAP